MKYLFLILFFIFNMYVQGQTTEKRAIYLFYQPSGQTILGQQVSELEADKEGLKDRDIVIHKINMTTDMSLPKLMKVDSNKNFIFILVGKDGEEKLRSDAVVRRKQLFGVIDAMPMRKKEMKDKKRG